ncbi:hypothetical protein [Absidia glauca]|uniref:Retrotransposon gag domain-containing protein n=1 Tax=Absidia glauca TaxID=4829 RepID=A0A163J5W5_ABSGL|nr:hypothetical protein [Absidia glauca]
MANSGPPPHDYYAMYLRYDRAKSVSMPQYNIKNSLRAWLLDYERQALSHGVLDLDDCPQHVAQYMPLIIQRWIPSLPTACRSSWSSFKELLLRRFGKPIEDENKQLIKSLTDLRQSPDTPTTLHAAEWEHRLSLLTGKLDVDRQAYLFIQSLHDEVLRVTLLNWYDDKQPDSIADIIEKAIHMEYKAELRRDLANAPTAPTSNTILDDTRMEVDHINGQQKTPTNSRRKESNTNNATPRDHSQDDFKFGYDAEGNPICDHCGKLHRTKDCNKAPHQSATKSNNKSGNRRRGKGHSEGHKNVNNAEGSHESGDDKLQPSVHTVDSSQMFTLLASFSNDHYANTCTSDSPLTPKCVLTIRPRSIYQENQGRLTK